jgi:leucyl aminopeptidase
MRLMKKDMGGAAHVIGLASLIMSVKLPIRLRVLIPAVENAIAGQAFRPGDVLSSRQGIRIEVDNTDAEGRLVLCDALAEAADEEPALIIDFATLTGAARVALGTELPGFFTRDNDMAAQIKAIAEQVGDPLWPLPLHRPYRYVLDSNIADIVNSTTESFGGAITAALFLQEFLPKHQAWVHVDVMGWNLRNRPGHPIGGEAMGMRALYAYLETHYPPQRDADSVPTR